MYEEIKESVAVLSLFKNGKIYPQAFSWQNRRYPVDEITLTHEEKMGNKILFCYSLTSAGNNYELSFDNTHLIWTLERIWHD